MFGKRQTADATAKIAAYSGGLDNCEHISDYSCSRRREKIIVYGDCQAQCLFNALVRTTELAKQYEFRLHFVGEQSSCWDKWRDDLADAACVFMQDIPQSSTHPTNHLATPQKSRVINFPALSLPSLWPFSTAFGGKDTQADKNRTTAGGGGLHADALLGALRPVRDLHSRLSAYLSLQDCGLPEAAKLIARRDPQRIHEFDAYRLQHMDERLASNVGRSILLNFRQRRLFHIMRHPTVELLAVVARELFQKFVGSGNLRLSSERDDSDYYQIPIHPMVANDLSLRWVVSGSRYRVYGNCLTVQDYALSYMKVYDTEQT